MQVATAFFQVQMALNWLVDNAIRLAEWIASAQRVVELAARWRISSDSARKDSEVVELGASPDDAIHIENLSVRLRNGS